MRGACVPCPPGYSTYAFGSSSCRACLFGTYASGFGSVACQVCPAGQSTAQEGASSCAPAAAASSSAGGSSTRQARLISFLLALNMSRDAINALTVRNTGINATGASIVQLAVRADTASALKIPSSNVQVSPIQQEDPSMFLVNVTATLPVYAPERDAGGGGGGSGGSKAPDKAVDADKLIERLVGDPPSAFPRTYEVTGEQRASLEASAASMHACMELLPCNSCNSSRSKPAAHLAGPFVLTGARKRKRRVLLAPPCHRDADAWLRCVVPRLQARTRK